MNLRSIVEPTHTDRELVDLLFFPAGGGKTEAYQGLVLIHNAAFARQLYQRFEALVQFQAVLQVPGFR